MRSWLALVVLFPVSAFAQSGTVYVPNEALDQNGPRLLESRDFPASVSGFTFGAAEKDNLTRCKKAGEKPKAETAKVYGSCSGAASPTPFTGSVIFVACGGKACEFSISLKTADRDGLVDANRLLVDKYGPPHLRTKTLAEPLAACAGPSFRESYASESWWFGPNGAKTGKVRLEVSCHPFDYGTNGFLSVTVRYQNVEGMRRADRAAAQAEANY